MWQPLVLAPPSPGAAANSLSLSFVSADPWTPNRFIDLKGDHTFLSFPNAVNAVSESLAALSVPALLAVAVTAANYGEFAARLSAFSAAFPLPFFQRLARRAQALETLETSKFELATPSPSANSMDLSGLPKLKAIRRADLLKAASDAADDFATSDPLLNLAGFEAEKAAHAGQVATAQADASAGLAGSVDGGWRCFADADVFSALRSGHPGHEFTLTALVVFVGTPVQLALPAAIFGAAP